jgi:hypothetical protein
MSSPRNYLEDFISMIGARVRRKKQQGEREKKNKQSINNEFLSN